MREVLWQGVTRSAVTIIAERGAVVGKEVMSKIIVGGQTCGPSLRPTRGRGEAWEESYVEVDGIGLQKVQLDAGSPTCSEPQPATPLTESQCHHQALGFPVAKKECSHLRKKWARNRHALSPRWSWTVPSHWLLAQRLVFSLTESP